MSDKILERVRALLALADHPGTPRPEAETAQRQAYKMMTRHAIDEAMLNASLTDEQRRQPVKVVFTLKTSEVYEFLPYLRTMIGYIARFNRARAVTSVQRVDGEQVWVCEVWGFREDASWIEMLFTQCQMQMISTMHPRWDEKLSLDHNVYNFKVAGIPWPDIHEVMEIHGHPPVYTFKPHGGRQYSKLLTMYKRHARKVGDTVLVDTQRHDAYRRTFVESFVGRIGERLYEMHKEMKEEIASSGAELVLFDEMEMVNDALYAQYPHMRPQTAAQQEEMLRQAREAQLRSIQEREEMLAKMTQKQRHDFLEKEQREEARDNKRWERQQHANRVDTAGSAAGRQSANKVDLVRKERVSTQKRGEIDG